MANPCQRNLAVSQLWKPGADMLANTGGQERFPNHLIKESAWIEVLARREILKGPRQRFASADGPSFCHQSGVIFAHIFSNFPRFSHFFKLFSLFLTIPNKVQRYSGRI